MSTVLATIPPVSQPTDTKVGFTPWAYDHLIMLTNDGESGYPKDAKVRLFIMTGHDIDGKRIRRALNGTTLAVCLDYNGRWGFTRLWVESKGGRRHLVHRKA